MFAIFINLIMQWLFYIVHFIFKTQLFVKLCIFFNFQTLNPVWNEEFVFRVSCLHIYY